MIIDDDGLDHRKLPRDKDPRQREREISYILIHQVSSDAAESHNSFFVLLVYNTSCLTAYQ
jgi:hypothetical protein